MIGVKGIIAYILLRLTAQAIGVRQVSQVSLLEITLLISLAFFAGLGAIWPQISLVTVAIVYVLWLILFMLERYVMTRSRKLRQSVLGEPTMLIYQGKLLEHNLYRKRLSAEQLLSKLRSQMIFDLADVEMAVLEPEGMLSVLRFPQAEPLTKQDMLIAGQHKGLPVELISDGQIIYENLKQRGLTEKWLRDHLRAFNVEFASEVALATVDDNKQLYVDLYDDSLATRDDLHSLAEGKRQLGYAGTHPLQEKPQSTYERLKATRDLKKREQESNPHMPSRK